jgi:hypothetical protein
MIPVVDYERMQRLRCPPSRLSIPFNLNSLCIIFIVLVIVGLYRRAVVINQSREPPRT